MYNQFLSSAWIFDRCQEVSSIHPLYPSILFGLIFLYILWRKDKKIIRPLVISGITSFLFFIAYILTAFIVGYGVINCAASRRYWPLVRPAIQLNAELNHFHANNLELPKNAQELKEQFPKEYDQATSNAQITYFYNSEENHYVMAVRASSYIVHVFDSKRKTSHYQLGHVSFIDNKTAEKFSEQNFYEESLIPK